MRRCSSAVFDPYSTRTVDGRLVRDPFAGNRIPASRLDMGREAAPYPVRARLLQDEDTTGLTIAQIDGRLEEELALGGAFLDGIYYCPHHPQGVVEPYNVECDCRKPRRFAEGREGGAVSPRPLL